MHLVCILLCPANVCSDAVLTYNVRICLSFTNTDSMADTFYAIGLVMRVCQSISLLELLHIYIGIESNQLFPRFLQVSLTILLL